MDEPIYEINRDWMESYLDVTMEARPDLFFEAETIRKNEPEGICRFTEYDADGVHHLRYRITGKKPLSAVFKVMPIKEWHLKKVLGSLINILEQGQEYLLDGDSFFLTGDTVFVDVQTYEPWIVYVPGYRKNLNDQMGQLMEFMLNRLDYDDKAAVNLLYDCFAGNCMENAGLKDIKERLQKIAPEIMQDDNAAESPETSEAFEKDEEKSGLKALFAKIKSLFIKSKDVYYEEEDEEVVSTGDTVFLNKGAYVYERAEEDKTVFLPGKIMGSTPWLVDIRTNEVVKLVKSPFSMGSLPDYNDYCMNDPRISRLHAAITSTEGRYTIMDLNSTNGTFVNDKEVMPGHDEQLYNNDKIRLADREFIYKAGDLS